MNRPPLQTVSSFDELLEFKGVTRVEVIDQNGRSYVNWNEKNTVKVSLQDQGRTLKLFINQSN